jgi:hypothetical protein
MDFGEYWDYFMEARLQEKRRERIRQARAIWSMPGTRSQVVEELDKQLKAMFPDHKWTLQGAELAENGWYECQYLYVHKSKENDFREKHQRALISACIDDLGKLKVNWLGV